ncbi:MAG: hypothetical protein IPO38_13685 [Rhodocyclaceae bacterium]|nr:hypothetical protein [Rhodocyclaceae bacterium]
MTGVSLFIQNPKVEEQQGRIYHPVPIRTATISMNTIKRQTTRQSQKRPIRRIIPQELHGEPDSATQ